LNSELAKLREEKETNMDRVIENVREEARSLAAKLRYGPKALLGLEARLSRG
jgi:hypothetical protein